MRLLQGYEKRGYFCTEDNRLVCKQSWYKLLFVTYRHKNPIPVARWVYEMQISKARVANSPLPLK